MNRITWKLIFCTSLASLCSTTELAHARGVGNVSAGVVAGKIAQTQTGATKAAEQAEAGPGPVPTPADTSATPAASEIPVNPCQIPTLMQRWYMGVQLGYGTYRVRNSITNPASSGITSNLVAAANGFAAGILMGYGRMVNPWFYLGAEAFIDANNFDQNYSYNNGIGTPTYTNLTNNGPTLGFGILPGIKLTESTLTYLRLGWNRLTIKTIETFTGTVVTGNRSISRTGFVFGAGIETLIMDNYSVRGEFDHMYFNSYRTYNPYNTTVSPSSNQYMLSLIYHFA